MLLLLFSMFYLPAAKTVLSPVSAAPLPGLARLLLLRTAGRCLPAARQQRSMPREAKVVPFGLVHVVWFSYCPGAQDSRKGEARWCSVLPSLDCASGSKLICIRHQNAEPLLSEYEDVVVKAGVLAYIDKLAD